MYTRVLVTQLCLIVWPHGLQPAKLLCPWNSPSKNAGEGSHSLLQLYVYKFSSVQSFSRVQLVATPWIAACQASLSITNPWSSLRLTSIESVMPSSDLILCHPLLLLSPIPPSIRVSWRGWIIFSKLIDKYLTYHCGPRPLQASD